MPEPKNRFSPYLLKSILSLLLQDQEYKEKFFPILNVEHFNVEDKMVYTLARAIWGMNEKYSKYPSVEALAEEIFIQKGKNIDLFMSEPSKEELSALLDFFTDIVDTEISDKNYVEDNTTRILGFLAVQKVILQNKQAFSSGILDVEEFTKDIVTATTFISPVSLGTNLYENLDKRTEERSNAGPVPGLIELNVPYFASFLPEGGLPPGSLAFYLASTAGGKSSSLVQLSHDAALRGHNVLYVTAELSEDLIKQKFDSCMTGVDSRDIRKQAGYVRAVIQKSPRFVEAARRIHIVEVPEGQAKPFDLEVLVERLKKKGFNTNLLVVDYADNLKSDSRNKDYRHEIKSIYTDLRAIAKIHKLVVWTASQYNDAGSEAAEKKNGIITVRHMNESRGKIHIADFCIAVARTQEEKEAKMARLVLLKNRLGPGDGAVVQINTRFDISRMFGEEQHVVPMSSINLDEKIDGLEDLSEPPEYKREFEIAESTPLTKIYRLE